MNRGGYMSDEKHHDQAEELRRLVEKQNSEIVPGLPPRSEVHKHKRNKKIAFKIKFPIVRLLLILFFIIVILAITSPIWLEKFV